MESAVLKQQDRVAHMVKTKDKAFGMISDLNVDIQSAQENITSWYNHPKKRSTIANLREHVDTTRKYVAYSPPTRRS